MFLLKVLALMLMVKLLESQKLTAPPSYLFAALYSNLLWLMVTVMPRVYDTSITPPPPSALFPINSLPKIFTVAFLEYVTSTTPALSYFTRLPTNLLSVIVTIVFSACDASKTPPSWSAELLPKVLLFMSKNAVFVPTTFIVPPYLALLLRNLLPKIDA